MWTEGLLENWHMMCASDELEVRAILIDLTNAIAAAGLSDVELRAIKAVYMDDPTPPVRDGRSQRPAGGSTRESAAAGIGISRATLWKVLNTAILKIEDTLEYGEIPATTMRSV